VERDPHYCAPQTLARASRAIIKNAFHRVPPLLGWPPHLHTDAVAWLPSEGRWVGRTSPKLTKKARDAAANARHFCQHERPQPDPPPSPRFDDLF
jgi:hypothetical protein